MAERKCSESPIEQIANMARITRIASIPARDARVARIVEVMRSGEDLIRTSFYPRIEEGPAVRRQVGGTNNQAVERPESLRRRETFVKDMNA